MVRYFFHLRDFEGNLLEDQEGFECRDLAEARDTALKEIRALAAEVISAGEEATTEAIVIADRDGTHLIAVPLVLALPDKILGLLKHPEKVVPTNRLDEYRRYADDCRARAEESANADDKMSWLKLADGWLRMLPSTIAPPGWPKSSEEDSKASH
jgi:hypothetical protein